MPRPRRERDRMALVSTHRGPRQFPLHPYTTPVSTRHSRPGNSHCTPTSMDNIRQRTRGLSAKTSAIYTLWLLEYINCDQHRRRRPLIFKPVGGLLVFRPEISRTNLS